jgi:hypothetical protein
MDCLRSFIISIRQNSTFGGPQVKTWTIGTENFWSAAIGAVSLYNIQGFKNINIFGVDLVGKVSTDVNSAIGGVVVNDWSFTIRLDGQVPLINGQIIPVPNFWNIQDTNIDAQTFALSKNTNSAKFATPFQSVKNIEFLILQAEGVGAQTLLNATLDYDFTFTFYYKYEGE